MRISRESNPGHIDGNDVFYHETTDADMPTILGPFYNAVAMLVMVINACC